MNSMSHLGFRLVMDESRWAEMQRRPPVAMAGPTGPAAR